MTDHPKYNPQIHHRRSIRLKGYDYSQAGAYFITICAHNRECLFGEIVDEEMVLNEYGKLVEYTWADLVNHVEGIELVAFVVMPNHVHGIIDIVGAGSEPARTEPARTEPARTEPAPTEPAPTGRYGLPEIVRQFKTFSARRINTLRNTSGTPVWQRNYWEHIIRNEKSYNDIAAYITNNPVQWEIDQLYVGNKP